MLVAVTTFFGLFSAATVHLTRFKLFLKFYTIYHQADLNSPKQIKGSTF